MSQRIDGRAANSAFESEYDVVIIGSGPAGAVVANEVAASGASVLVLEEGEWIDQNNYSLDMIGAQSKYYRDMGISVTEGAAIMPYVQGQAVGGSSVVNGAICWRLPESIFQEWIQQDPDIEQDINWQMIEQATDDVEKALNVKDTDEKIAKSKNLLMAKGADALGLKNRPIRRNVVDCEGLSLCLHGCPKGHKLSMDQSYLLEAEKKGAVIFSSASVEKILHKNNRAYAVQGITKAGDKLLIKAKHALVLAASAVQSPVLLLKSGIKHGPVGENFSAHPGLGVTGYFPESVKMWEGATQGHEVISHTSQGIKFESQGFNLEIIASRLSGIGSSLMKNMEDMEHFLIWCMSLRAEARGKVSYRFGRSGVSYRLTPGDVDKFRLGVRLLGEMLFAAGAEYIEPGVKGFDRRVTDPKRLQVLEKDGPRKQQALQTAITHMFGTCRMGSDLNTNVVRPDFRHQTMEQLYIADSSVFPSNTGVNPMVSIMALAKICGQKIVAA